MASGSRGDAGTLIRLWVAGDPIAIRAPRHLLAPIRATFVDCLTGPAGAPVVEIEISGDPGSERISVGERVWNPGSVTDIIDQLVYVVLRSTLDAHPERVHLHAGYVSMEGAGALIAGNPGSGKSTLMTRLVADGFDFLTDERVGVDVHGRLWPCSLPISVTAGSFEALADLDPSLTGAGSGSERLWHLPASVIRAGSVVTESDPRVLAFVQFHPRAPLDVATVHPAEAVRLLLADSGDAARSGVVGLANTARLVAGLHCVRIGFGDAGVVPGALRELLSVDRPARLPVELVHPPTARRVAPALAAGWAGVSIDDRCVVQRLSDRAIVELDAMHASWLRLLDGVTAISTIVVDVAAANDLPTPSVQATAEQVLGDLRRLGVIS